MYKNIILWDILFFELSNLNGNEKILDIYNQKSKMKMNIFVKRIVIYMFEIES